MLYNRWGAIRTVVGILAFKRLKTSQGTGVGQLQCREGTKSSKQGESFTGLVQNTSME